MGLANIAAKNMEHLCVCPAHGYSWSERWGNAGLGSCYVVEEGHTSEFYRGDRDCSSAVIDCWQEALIGTAYEGALAGATYTGNMRSVFVGSGLFTWEPMSFIAQRGDIYLNEVNHTAMCTQSYSTGYDELGEFCINEHGGCYGGESGDQTGNESHLAGYYDYPWDGILHYNGLADGTTNAPIQTEPEPEPVAEPVAEPETEPEPEPEKETKMDAETQSALVRLIAAIIMPILTAIGVEVEADDIIVALSGGLSIIAVLWAWWKNNNVTSAAKEAQKVLDELKA